MSRSSRRRDTNVISNRRLPVSFLSRDDRFDRGVFPSSLGLSPLRDFEDLRTWHPDRLTRPPRTFTSGVSRVFAVERVSSPRTAAKVRRSRNVFGYSRSLGTVAFQKPDSTVLCVRRQQRREVLHALGGVHPGGGSGSKSKWTEWSNVRCR